MFKHLDGDYDLSVQTNEILQLLSTHCAEQEKRSKKVTMETITEIPGFKLPVKGNYRFVLTTFDSGGLVSVYNGQDSFIDWLAMCRLNQVILRGVEIYPDHISAAKGLRPSLV